ncbi:MAG: cation:proton antiporter [Candidatus Sericytochromatia bacterium]
MIAWIGLAGLYLGIVIAAAGVLGLYRFPDAYTRLNALAKVTTVGALLIHLSSAALLPFGQGAKGVLTALVLLLTTPVVTMAIALAAHRTGVPNITHTDDLARDEEAGP